MKVSGIFKIVVPLKENVVRVRIIRGIRNIGRIDGFGPGVLVVGEGARIGTGNTSLYGSLMF